MQILNQSLATHNLHFAIAILFYANVRLPLYLYYIFLNVDDTKRLIKLVKDKAML